MKYCSLSGARAQPSTRGKTHLVPGDPRCHKIRSPLAVQSPVETETGRHIRRLARGPLGSSTQDFGKDFERPFQQYAAGTPWVHEKTPFSQCFPNRGTWDTQETKHPFRGDPVDNQAPLVRGVRSHMSGDPLESEGQKIGECEDVGYPVPVHADPPLRVPSFGFGLGPPSGRMYTTPRAANLGHGTPCTPWSHTLCRLCYHSPAQSQQAMRGAGGGFPRGDVVQGGCGGVVVVGGGSGWVQVGRVR